MSKKKLTGILATCVVAVIVIVAMALPAPTSQTPARFDVLNLELNPEAVAPGETVTVTVDVLNVGEEEGTHVLKLMIDGVLEQTQSITLDEGESFSSSFMIQREVEGFYSVELGGLTGAFEVVETEEPSDALEEVRVYFLDVGQADATLFVGTDFAVLIDAGDHRRNDVVPHLMSVGVTEIDLLIGTHPHADHIGQFPQVLESFPVGEVWMSGDLHTTLTFERAVDAILDSGTVYNEPRAREVFEFGTLLIEVINPYELTGDFHEGSISVRITYGEVSFVFTGDAETHTEQAMIDRGHDLEAQVLHLGHHGSRTSSGSAFLEAVSPDISIYSAGEGNRYGHPHEEVVQRVTAMGIALYGTDIHGTVVIVTDGVTYNVETEYSVPPLTGPA